MNIEDIFIIDYNWSHLIGLIVILTLVYLLLIFIRKIIFSVALTGRFRTVASKIVDTLLIAYEPLSILFIVCLFVMIKPVFHGLIIGIFILFGFVHIRNYVHGRIVIFEKALRIGRQISIAAQKGTITNIGRLGIQVRSDDGLHYLPYHKLVTHGFALSSGDKIGGYYFLQIKTSEKTGDEHPAQELSDILISSPYIDGDHKPEISRSISADGTISVKLLVKEENHVYDLISLLEENGYTSFITKS